MNFEYSLLNDQGKMLEFKREEDKIPALNFAIQDEDLTQLQK